MPQPVDRALAYDLVNPGEALRRVFSATRAAACLAR